MAKGCPGKKAVQRLVEAHAYMLHVPETKRGQQIYDRHRKWANRLSERYPECDMSSERAIAAIRRRAEEWWRSRLFSGPGVDW